jgi:autophagy-related protein 11
MLFYTELKHFDNNHRHELEQVTDRKVSISYGSNFIPLFNVTAQNIYTHRCLTVLHNISSLNNELVHLPPALSALQSSFRGKTSFSHIQRLHTMLYAYGATIIEIVRRKEFCKPFSFFLC